MHRRAGSFSTSPSTASMTLVERTTQLETDRETPALAKERILGQLEFMETMVTWYDSIKALPRKTLLKMMRLGQKIAKVIGE